MSPVVIQGLGPGAGHLVYKSKTAWMFVKKEHEGSLWLLSMLLGGGGGSILVGRR